MNPKPDLTKATPRPWRNCCDKDIGENGSRIQDAEGRTIASTNYRAFSTDFANASLIVQAVNEYDAIRKLLERALFAFQQLEQMPQLQEEIKAALSK